MNGNLVRKCLKMKATQFKQIKEVEGLSEEMTAEEYVAEQLKAQLERSSFDFKERPSCVLKAWMRPGARVCLTQDVKLLACEHPVDRCAWAFGASLKRGCCRMSRRPLALAPMSTSLLRAELRQMLCPTTLVREETGHHQVSPYCGRTWPCARSFEWSTRTT